MGAPDGFIDVVASLNPIAADDAATPRALERHVRGRRRRRRGRQARELGGKVISAPTDAPWLRTALVEDPQGATFFVSQFVPENKDLGA